MGIEEKHKNHEKLNDELGCVIYLIHKITLSYK